MSVRPSPEDVFLNVPFDAKHERLYLALIAGLTGLGLTPRSVLEIPPAENRLHRILRLIQGCASSIHDLSRVQLSRDKPRCPRFNMPFEAGLAVAWAHFAPGTHQWFVFESKPHRLLKSLSDLNGFDPLIHNGTISGLLGVLTNAFVRPEVHVDQLLVIYRQLHVVAENLKKSNRDKDLFKPAPFRDLVWASQKITAVTRAGLRVTPQGLQDLADPRRRQKRR